MSNRAPTFISDLPLPDQPVLDYAPHLRSRVRWLRRVVFFAVIAALIWLAISYTPRIVRQARLLHLQSKCLNAQLPADRPLFKWGPDAPAFAAAHPGEYCLARGVEKHAVMRTDPRWADLSKRIGISPSPIYAPYATIFMHERISPSGHRRLVVIEVCQGGWGNGALLATVVEPGGMRTAPRVVGPYGGLIPNDSWTALGSAMLTSRHHSLSAGVPDPNDASRFTIPMTIGDTTGYFEGQLADDERVTIRLSNPREFVARTRIAAGLPVTDPEPSNGSFNWATPSGRSRIEGWPPD